MTDLQKLLEAIEFDRATRAEKFTMFGDGLEAPDVEELDHSQGEIAAVVQTLANLVSSLRFMQESIQGQLELLGEASGNDLRYIEAIVRHLADEA